MVYHLLKDKSNILDAADMLHSNWDLYTNGIGLIINNYKMVGPLWKRFFDSFRLSICAVSVLGQKDFVESGIKMLTNSALPASLDFKANSDLSLLSQSINEKESVAFESLAILGSNLLGTGDVAWTLLYECSIFYEFTIKCFPKNGIPMSFDIELVNGAITLCNSIIPRAVIAEAPEVIFCFSAGLQNACKSMSRNEAMVAFYRQHLVSIIVVLINFDNDIYGY